MSLEHMVLAVLAEAPAHGYAVWRCLHQTLGRGRPSGRSRVYRALADLERMGWVHVTRLDDRSHGARKVYRVLPPGAEVLEQWLERPRPAGGLLRRALLVRLAMSASEVAPTAATAWRVELEARLRRRERVSVPSPAELPIARLARLREVAHLEAEIRILEETGRLKLSRPLPARSSASR